MTYNQQPGAYYPPASTRRPGMVTFLVVLIVIIGILLVLAGAALLLLRNQDWIQDSVRDQIQVTGATLATGLLIYAIGILVVGVIYLLVASGLAKGNNFSRAVVAVISVLQIIAGLYSIIENTGTLRNTGIGNIVFGVLILLILFSPSSNAFFRSR